MKNLSAEGIQVSMITSDDVEELSLRTVQKISNYTLTGILLDFDCEHSAKMVESVRKSKKIL